jgi:uncharacterized protein (TIGR00251 family)
MGWYRWEEEDLILHVRLQPKSSRNAFVSPYGENEFKIAICAPPVGGKANQALIKFLAKEFGLPSSRVIMESGATSRSKILRLKKPVKKPIIM